MNLSEMLPSFDAIKESFSDPQRLHAIIVHMPIGVTVIGLLLTLGVIITGSKAAGLRWTTVFVYLLGTLAALWAVQTGEEAEHALLIEPVGSAHDVLEKHESLAEYFWIGLAVTAMLIMLSGIRVGWLKTVTLLLALITAAGSTAWVGAIGHHGGEMVYRHSVGVPSAGPQSPSGDPNKDGDGKDAKDSKDKEATKDGAKDEPVKDEPTKDQPVKDAPAKDEATKDAPVKDATKSGERKLPDATKKDASIFCE